MPTEISNAVGTARQFTPQPQSSYQGNYGGVNPTRFQANTSKEVQLAQSIQQLSNALLSYRVRHEEYKDKKGLAEAERMVNGMSPEDIQKLNLIEASQKYGYVDETANPYFKAYVDKLRGGFVASRMKQEYDEYIKNNPPKTIEDSYKSWDSFSKAYIAQFKEDNPVENNTAFDMGYNEQNLVTGIQMTNQFMTEKRKEDLEVAIAHYGNKLGDVVLNAHELLKTNGLMTETIQTILNEGVLANLSPQEKMKALGGCFTAMISTGRIDSTRLFQMCDRLTLTVDEEGNPVTVGSLINKNSIVSLEEEYKTKVMPILEYEEINTLIENGEKSVTDLKKEVAEAQQSAPHKVPYLLAKLQMVQTGVERKMHREQALAVSNSRDGMLSFASEKEAKIARDNLKSLADDFCAGLDIVETHMGVPLRDVPKMYPASMIKEVSMAKMAEIMEYADKDPRRAMQMYERHFNNPVFKEFTKDYGKDRLSYLQSLQPNADGSPLHDPVAGRLCVLHRLNPAVFNRVFGNELYEEVSMINIVMSAHGGGLNKYAELNNLDNTAREDLKSKANDKVYSLKNVIGGNFPTLDGGTESEVTIPAHLMTTVKKAYEMGFYLNPKHPDVFVEKYLSDNYYWAYDSLIPRALVPEQKEKPFFTALHYTVYKENKGKHRKIENIHYLGGNDLQIFFEDGGASILISAPAIEQNMMFLEQNSDIANEFVGEANKQDATSVYTAGATTYSQAGTPSIGEKNILKHKQNDVSPKAKDVVSNISKTVYTLLSPFYIGNYIPQQGDDD